MATLEPTRRPAAARRGTLLGGAAASPGLSGDAGVAIAADEAGGDDAGLTRRGSGLAIATARDAAGAPLHRGWLPVAGHHRWLEPFVLMALAGGSTHGYAIIGVLTDVGLTEAALDVGQVYRTLRDLEQAGQISSTWTTGVGPARRDYTITPLGAEALDEWAAVMMERSRLIAEFDAAYLGWLAGRARGDG
ncbi:MAG TPA: helix-turn-helix transcriptional regulator [Candidatus Limnocylindrales bacterium]